MPVIGKLISIEGIDGCGKDTQVANVYNFLHEKGVGVVVYNFPNYHSMLGQCIQQALTDKNFSPQALQLLFSADRAQQFQSVSLDLQQKKTVLTSRSKWSSYVYAVSRGLSREWAGNIESFIQEPDLVLYLDIDVETSIARTGGADLLERDHNLLALCREEYLILAKNKNWHTVDATQSLSNVFHDISNYLGL